MIVWLGSKYLNTVNSRAVCKPAGDDYASGISEERTWGWKEQGLVPTNLGCVKSSPFSNGEHHLWSSLFRLEVKRFDPCTSICTDYQVSPDWQQAGLEEVNFRPLLELLDTSIGQALDKPWGI